MVMTAFTVSFVLIDIFPGMGEFNGQCSPPPASPCQGRQSRKSQDNSASLFSTRLLRIAHFASRSMRTSMSWVN